MLDPSACLVIVSATVMLPSGNMPRRGNRVLARQPLGKGANLRMIRMWKANESWSASYQLHSGPLHPFVAGNAGVPPLDRRRRVQVNTRVHEGQVLPTGSSNSDCAHLSRLPPSLTPHFPNRRSGGIIAIVNHCVIILCSMQQGCSRDPSRMRAMFAPR